VADDGTGTGDAGHGATAVGRPDGAGTGAAVPIPLGRGVVVLGTGTGLRPAVAGAEGRTVRFADGSSLDAGIVIWTTGYRPGLLLDTHPGVAGDGRLIHRRGVTDVPGLYFLGLPWQHRRGSALLGFVQEDAAYLAGRVTSRAPARQSAARPASQQPG